MEMQMEKRQRAQDRRSLSLSFCVRSICFLNFQNSHEFKIIRSNGPIFCFNLKRPNDCDKYSKENEYENPKKKWEQMSGGEWGVQSASVIIADEIRRKESNSKNYRKKNES